MNGSNQKQARCDGKIRYLSWSQADKAGGRQRKNGLRYTPYLCNFCGGFHLTGSPNRSQHRPKEAA